MENKKIKRKVFTDNCVSLLNAPYHPLGRSEAGIDCVGVPIVGMKKSGIDIYDMKVYPHNGDGITLSKILGEMGRQKSISDIKEGDILLIKFSRHPQHVAVYLGDHYKNGENYMIHAYSIPDKVIIENVRDWLSSRRIVAAFELNDFED